MNEKLQKRIVEAANKICCTDCPFESIRNCKECVEKENAIKTANFALQNQWISVEEALPEIKEHFVSKDVLCIYSDGQMGFSRLKENLFGQKWFEYESEESVVTHWMTIPETKGDEK